ncbi:MAG: hypothetical protein FGF52_03990 [Candidatus Brockarchaeota archaeon]|nr:hypothetical protein [Candidatus Brockarchaeota archaeon]
MKERASAYYTVLLILLTRFLIVERAYAAPYALFVNSSFVSMRITGLLSNRVLVETVLDNRVPMNFSTRFRPECLNISTQDSTLIIVYDARIPGYFPMQSTSMRESDSIFDEWLKSIQLLAVFATGLALLVLEALAPKANGEDVIKMIEEGKSPPRGSAIDEESLLLLSSRNPEAYRRIADMVLRGELKIKRKRLKSIGKLFSRTKKLAKYMR